MANRQELFSRADLQRFRERQMADLEHRAFKTISDHAAVNGNKGAPTLEMELGSTLSNIKLFAEQQVDKMRLMGIENEQIRQAVVGSIQKATLGLAPGNKANTFENLLENLNSEVEHYIQQTFDPLHSSEMKLA